MATNHMVQKATKILRDQSIGKEKTTLVTSFCNVHQTECSLETELAKKYGNPHRIGGPGGFTFAGFSGMWEIINSLPRGQSAVIVYGPHLEVDGKGNLKVPDQVGNVYLSSLLREIVDEVNDKNNNKKKKSVETEKATDGIAAEERRVIEEQLKPYMRRLTNVEQNSDIGLALTVFDCQREHMLQIVREGIKGSTSVSSGTKVAVLGSIQIVTPPGQSNFCMPLSFKLYNAKGDITKDLLWKEKPRKVGLRLPRF